MYVFAESSQGNSFSFPLFMFIMILGLYQCSKWLKGNSLARGVAKKGVLHILGRMFK